MRELLILLCVVLVASSAGAHTATESWEGARTVLGMYGTGEPPIIAEAGNWPCEAIDGWQTLQLIDNSPMGTPQAYVAWIQNLEDGDVVDVSIWRFDETEGAAPSCRLRAHWNDTPDVNGYSGAAGGNDDFGPGIGWDEVAWSWTVVDGHTGLVIEVRTYSYPGDTVWVDMMTVTAPDYTTITTPGSAPSPVTEESWSAIKALYQ